MNTLLFSYQEAPAYYGYGENDTGFSVDIYSNRLLIYKIYSYDEGEDNVKFQKAFSLSKVTIDKITKLLMANKNNIFSLEEIYDNDVDDGTGYFFNFIGKKITVWDIKNIDKRNLAINEVQQLYILLLFKKIAKLLKAEGLFLGLNGFKNKRGLLFKITHFNSKQK